MSETRDPFNTMAAPHAQTESFGAGRYAVRRLLGEGGQKSVYLARDTQLDRDVAIALLKTEGLDEQSVARVKHEARAMARLEAHAGIVAIYDIGQHGDRPYLVCEHVAGGDLREELRQAGGPLPVERALGIAQDITQALAVAHDHGVLHRDIKPANIWLTEQGRAKLGDFGLAVALGRTRITQAGTIVGTAAYMAPEQAISGNVDARSDLYALGCVLYETVTGRAPFAGGDVVSVISQHVHTPPIAPSWHNPSVFRALDNLILRLLAKRPEDRPVSAAEVLQELSLMSRRLPETAGALQPKGPADLAGLTWGRFVGRRAEMERLIAALDDSLSGRSALVMVAGEPGIGKTRLAEEFAVYARLRGARVQTGRCSEGAGSVPYRPWVEALGGRASGGDDERRSETGPGAPDVLTLLSALRGRVPDVAEAPGLDPDAERLRLFDSVVEFIKNASQAEPLVLVMDDLHWADKPSLLLLQHVARNTTRDRLLIVGAYRDVELDRAHPLAEALGELRRSDRFQRVHLRGLPQEDVAELLTLIESSPEAMAGRAALARALHEETEGNPFFIREVLSHLVEEKKIVREDGRWTSTVSTITDLGIPEGVKEAIGRRLARLSEGCNRMLGRASAMTGGFTWEMLKALCDEPEEQLLELLEEALGAQLIAERRDAAGAPRALAYDFAHALIRQTLYEELSGPRRVLLHRRIGEALEQLAGGNIDAHLAELAYHFCQAAPGGGIDKAVDYARRAGDEASELLAFEEAVRLYGMALETLELHDRPDAQLRGRLLLALGVVQMRAGDFAKARETLRRCAALAQELGSAELLAGAALEYGWRFAPGMLEQDHIDLLWQALAAVSSDQTRLRRRLLSRLSLGLYWADRNASVAFADEAIAVARQSEDARQLGWAMLTRHFTLWVPEELDQRLAAAGEAIRLGEESGDNELIVSARCARTICLFESGEMAGADGELPVIERMAHDMSWPLYGWGSSLFRAVRALLEGNIADAEPLARQALSIGQKAHGETAGLAFGAQLLLLRREQDRLSEMEGAAKAFASDFSGVPAYRCVLAQLYAELGREAECREEYERLAQDDFSAIPRDYWWTISLALLAESAIYLGDRARALRLYELLAPYDGRTIIVPQTSVVLFLCYGTVARQLGLLADALGRTDDALRHLEDALELSRRMAARAWVAHVQHDLARVLARRDAPGDRAQARALFQEALASAEGAGMVKLASGCQRALSEL